MFNPTKSFDRDSASSFDPALSRALLFLTIPLLFLPKINLIAIAGQSAGLRIDDVLLLCTFFLMTCGVYASRRPLTLVERLFGGFLFSATLSVCLNWISFRLGILNSEASLLHVLRLAEYFTFFYVGTILVRYINVLTIMKLLFVVNVTVVLLQWFDVIGGFTVNGYASSVSSQPTGLAAGHWEIGFIFNLLYAVFLIEDPKITGFWRYPKASIFAWIVVNFSIAILTGCRSAVLGTIAITCYYAGRKVLLYLGVLAVVLLVCLLCIPNLSQLTLVERSEHLLNVDNIWVFLQFFDHLDVSGSSFHELYDHFTPLGDTPIDMSWFFRVYKWSYAIKYYLIHPFYYLLGLGPGYFGIAVDGGWVRLITEYGLLGTTLYCSTLYKASMHSSVLITCLLAFAVNLIFLDMFLAYKAMALYFLILGAFQSRFYTLKE